MIFLFLPCVLAQDITLEIEGSCADYNVTVIATGFEESCYDLKIDITTIEGRVGEIFDPWQGWKSSYFYIKEGFCVGTEDEIRSESYKVRTDSKEKLNFLAKLKHDSKVWDTTYYEVEQDCLKADDDSLFLVSLIVILILSSLIMFYVKIW